MKLMLTLMGSTLFVFLASAQYSEFIVLKNGDTLYGAIAYRNNIFKVKTVEGVTGYHASAVKIVRYSKFKGRVIFYKLYTYNANLQDISVFHHESKYLDSTLFLTAIYLTEKMNLYRAKDSYKTEYYLVEKPTDSIPTQLRVSYKIKSEYGKETSGFPNFHDTRTTLVQEKIYIGQLRVLMSDCSKLGYYDFENLDYQSYKFKNLIKVYNRECK